MYIDIPIKKTDIKPTCIPTIKPTLRRDGSQSIIEAFFQARGAVFMVQAFGGGAVDAGSGIAARGAGCIVFFFTHQF